MNSIELYKSLVRKALNGSLSKNEAITLKALDVLIESEDKIDEGVFDLSNYEAYFGPTVTEILSQAEPDNKIMADSLASFGGFSDSMLSSQFIQRTGRDPLEVLGGFEDKAKLIDNLNTDNPLEKAIGYNDSVGFVPDDIMKAAEDAVEPLTRLFDTQREIEKHLNNIPQTPAPGFTDDEWVTLRGWNNFEYGDQRVNIEENKTVDVMVKWIGSLGLPILGGFTGGIGGAIAGGLVAPDWPIAETIELFDPVTQASIWSSMPAWLLPVIAKVKPDSGVNKVVDLAKENAKTTEGLVDLSKLSTEKAAAEIKKGTILGKAGKVASKKTAAFLNKFKGLKTWHKVALIGFPALVGIGGAASYGDQRVSPDSPTIEEQDNTEGVASVTPTTTTTTVPSGSLPAGIGPQQEEKTKEEMFEEGRTSADTQMAQEIWQDSGDLWGADEMFTVPDQYAPSYFEDSPIFKGLHFSGKGDYQPSGKFTTPEGEIKDDLLVKLNKERGIKDSDYMEPMSVSAGGKINKNVFQKVTWNNIEMTLLEFIGITAKNYDLDPAIIYGLIEHETQGSFNPSAGIGNEDGGPGWDSLGLGQINMNPNSFGIGGPANTRGEVPGDLEFITREQALDPVFSVNFIGHSLSRYQRLFGGGRLGLISALAAYNGGFDAGKVVFDSNGTEVKKTKHDQRKYIKAVLENSQNPITKEYYSKSLQDVMAMGVQREWDTFSPTGTEAVHKFIDEFIGENLAGVKATQEDYDEWRPRFLEAEKSIFTETQKAKDKDGQYKGLSVSEKLGSQMEDEPEYQFVDERKKHQKVQDWATDNLLGAFDI